MAVVDFFPKIGSCFPQFTGLMLKAGMVLVHFYHIFASNLLINTTFEDSVGIERAGNVLLAPVHYICGAKRVSYDVESQSYHLHHHFQYEDLKRLYTPLALTTFVPSLVLGGTIKSLAFLLPQVRDKHARLRSFLNSNLVCSQQHLYRQFGLEINDFMEGEPLHALGLSRRLQDRDHLKEEREALQQIIELFHQHEIPCWVDCGTLLGAYRYGGVIPWDNDVDLAVLVHDFDNITHLLRQLDPERYALQDWSNRNLPKTYLRLYLKKRKSHIDIYHFRVMPQSRQIEMILSNGKSHFMAQAWKDREQRFTQPFDFEILFPLKWALLDGIKVPVPCDTPAYLKRQYGENLHPVRVYDEQTGEYEKDLSHPYWQIPLVS